MLPKPSETSRERRCMMDWITDPTADEQASDEERRLSDINVGC